MIEIKARKLHPEAVVPKTWSEQAIGLDLHALLLTEQGRPNNKLLSPNFTVKIPTGICIECPRGYFATVCSRSGLAGMSVFVANGPGIIDPDYRGEIIVLLYNGGNQPQWIKHGDRVAQLVIHSALQVRAREVEELSDVGPLGRGTKGFGSTGA